MPFINSVRGTYGHTGIIPNNDGNPVLSGMTAWYKSENVSVNSWPDSSGNNRNISISSGSRSVVDLSAGNGSTRTIRCLQFDTNTSILWAPGFSISGNSSSGNYTIFTVARYRGGSSQRIFTGDGNNWLSGFWSGNSGTAYHENWMSGHPQNIHGSNWVLSSDQANLYRSNGVTRGTNFAGSFNCTVRTNGNEPSDGHIAEVIFYSRQLSFSEIIRTESYLSKKFGIAV